MKKSRLIGSLSVDLDNKWSYMRMHGVHGWECFPSYLDIVVPRILNFLNERNLTATFFVIGQDAALEKNHAALRSIVAAGHEIGNHSFHHEPWQYLLSEQRIEADIAQAEEHIERVTGQKPIGFRAPGYNLTPETLRVLARRGYLYDASTYPTFLGPLARLYFFMNAKLSQEEKEQRKKVFGTLGEALRPLRPYRWRTGSETTAGGLVELPVTTMPVFRTPIHFTYIHYLSRFSSAVALMYFRMALSLCRLTNTQPSVLLHPPDFLGCDDLEELSFFPSMDISSERKMQLISEALRLFSEQFTVLTMRQHAYEIM